jgi:hypothetical protein
MLSTTVALRTAPWTRPKVTLGNWRSVDRQNKISPNGKILVTDLPVDYLLSGLT